MGQVKNIKEAAEEISNWSKDKLENARQAFSEPVQTK